MVKKTTGVQLHTGVSLKAHTSYKIGGPSRYFFDAQSSAELVDAVRQAHDEHLKFFVIGGGTNLLVSDAGFDGLVLRPVLRDIKLAGEDVRVEAGASMAELLDAAAAKGLSGLEWAGGLPGTVGGAIRGNAGAFGGEMKDVVNSVTSLDTETLQTVTRKASECCFAYRSSIYKELAGREIILSAVLRLRPGDKKAIRSAIEEKIAYRMARHPMEYPNAGSIFKNIPFDTVPALFHKRFAPVVKTDPFPVVPVAYLISEAGLKGVSFGGALISPKHPNFIVNALGASSEDVEALIRLVKGVLRQKFQIAIEEEVMRL
jgi:UDP-N-acetylmuramate dehydrogenase